MTRKEANMLEEVANLMASCPGPSLNAYDLGGQITACRDFMRINSYAGGVLRNYSNYVFASAAAREDGNTEEADFYWERAHENLEALREYIADRRANSWQ